MTIPIENTGTSPLHVAGLVILPGETRLLNKALVPPHLRLEVAAELIPAIIDVAADVSGKKVAEIRTAIPNLTDDDLARLEALEATTGKQRVGVIEAITKERLRRAGLIEKLQEFNLAVAKMDADGLRTYRENVAEHPELVAAVDAEMQRRAGA